MNDWQDISTAPKKTYILLIRWAPDTQWHGRMEVDRYRADTGTFGTRNGNFGTFNNWYPPTHWMPLPLPPKIGETE